MHSNTLSNWILMKSQITN